MSPNVLTCTQAIDLAHIVQAAQQKLPVVRVVSSRVMHGVAQAIVCDRSGMDVRDGCLDVYLSTGDTASWNIAELLHECAEERFMIDVRSAM